MKLFFFHCLNSPVRHFRQHNESAVDVIVYVIHTDCGHESLLKATSHSPTSVFPLQSSPQLCGRCVSVARFHTQKVTKHCTYSCLFIQWIQTFIPLRDITDCIGLACRTCFSHCWNALCISCILIELNEFIKWWFQCLFSVQYSHFTPFVWTTEWISVLCFMPSDQLYSQDQNGPFTTGLWVV